MVGFNYIRTPASVCPPMIAEGVIGDVTWFRGEHTEDFLPTRSPCQLAHRGRRLGTLGDLAPHMINCALALLGPIESVMADFETVHKTRPA
jgi:predicted dehydrogenase